MITETGGDLTVVVATEPGKDWETFSTWYSFWKNLPDAEVVLLIRRNGSTPFNLFQWTKRLKVRSVSMNPSTGEDSKLLDTLAGLNIYGKSVRDRVLVVEPLDYATDLLEKTTAKLLEDRTFYWDGQSLLLQGRNFGKLIDSYWIDGWKPERSGDKLFSEAKETEEPRCLVSCHKGCGKWIHTAKGCPFSNAGGLIAEGMTANEHRVIELWQKMVTLYNSVI